MSDTMQHREHRHYSPSASINESFPRGLAVVMCVCGILGMVFGLTSFVWGYISERETRIMQDDVKYIRAYLSARGIQVPSNHEAAED